MTKADPRDARAYVTVLSTDSYLIGVLGLACSLRLCRSRYSLCVVVGSKVGADVRRTLEGAGLNTIAAAPLAIPEEILAANAASDYHRHWAGVFDKLLIFSLDQFAKIVYVDSDMLVLRNMDELFEQPHMSAVIADIGPGHTDHRFLNAGLMVIEPRPGLTAELVATLPGMFESEKRWREAAGRPASMGVQSVINAFWSEWRTDERLHLHPKYNVLVNELDYYLRRRGYRWFGRDGIRVLHFIGQRKPWMGPPRTFTLQLGRLVLRRRFYEMVANLAAALIYAVLAGRQRLQQYRRASP